MLWDSTYTDPAYTDPSMTAMAPAYPPRLIPMMRALVDDNYPGTKLAINEYHWGGQESVNGAIAQVEILAIFGREGLDVGALWAPPDPTTQLPGLLAFEIFQNYDGLGSIFGESSLAATSSDQGRLAIYAAERSKDETLTVLVLNKSFGDLTSTLTLGSSATASHVYRYSNLSQNAITQLWIASCLIQPGKAAF